MNQLCLLTIKMNSERLKNFKEDEDHVKNDGKDSDDDDDADPYGDEEFDDDSDEEWKKQQKIFASVGSKLHTGKPLTADEMKQVGVGIDDDEDDDSDYEYAGGDMSLYDSKLDDFDEIQHLQRSLMQIDGGNNQLY